jgi:DNA polymerase V
LLLVKDPEMTVVVRAEGDSMSGVGTYEGDILIVNRALQAQNGERIHHQTA